MKRVSVSWLLSIAWLGGCALDPAHQDDGTEPEGRLYDDEVELAVTEQAIRGGSEVPKRSNDWSTNEGAPPSSLVTFANVARCAATRP